MRHWLIALALIAAAGGGSFAYYYYSPVQSMTAEEGQKWREEQALERKAEKEIWVTSHPSKLIKRSWIKCETNEDCLVIQLSCGIRAINHKSKTDFEEVYKKVAPYTACSDGQLARDYKAVCNKNECDTVFSIDKANSEESENAKF